MVRLTEFSGKESAGWDAGDPGDLLSAGAKSDIFASGSSLEELAKKAAVKIAEENSTDVAEAKRLNPGRMTREDIKAEIVNNIDKNLKQLESAFHTFQARTGMAPAAHNWLSSNIGISAENPPFHSITGLWSFVFNKDATNDSISDQLKNARESWEMLKTARENGDDREFLRLYRSMTSNEARATLSDVGFQRLNKNISSFGSSQIFASELFSETVATVAAGLTLGKGKGNALRGLIMSATTSGATKTATKFIDGTNPDPQRDFLTGVNSGIALASGGLAGGFVSRRVANAFDLTTSGGTFYTTIKLTDSRWALRGVSAVSAEGVSGGTYGFTKTMGDQLAIRAIQIDRGLYEEFQPIHVPLKEAGLGFLGGGAAGLLRKYKPETSVTLAETTRIKPSQASSTGDDIFRYGYEQSPGAGQRYSIKDLKEFMGGKSIKAKFLVPEIQKAAAGKPHSAGLGANLVIQTNDKESPKTSTQGN